MRIFTKKSFRFDHPAGSNAGGPVITQALSFHDVPEWVKESGMFKLAYSAGEIDLPEGAKQEDKVEVAAHEEKKTKQKEAKAKLEAGE